MTHAVIALDRVIGPMSKDDAVVLKGMLYEKNLVPVRITKLIPYEEFAEYLQVKDDPAKLAEFEARLQAKRST